MAPVLSLLLAGCFPRIDPDADRPGSKDGSDADTDTDADADADSDADGAAIDTVSPTDGSTHGGSEVTISGAGFDAHTRVWFGDDEAEIVDRSAHSLVVETPSHDAGAVDVSVGRDEPGSTLSDAFTFWPDASGKTEAIVLWYYFWDSYSNDGGTYGVAWPITPTNAELYEIWSPDVDACGSSELSFDAWDADLSVFGNDGSEYEMTASNGTYGYSEDGTDWDSSVRFGVSVAGGTNVPDFTTDTFFHGPSSFRVTSPDLSSGLDFYLSGWPMTVEWTGGGGDFVLIWVHSASQDVYCVADDDGSFDVPSSAMDVFSWGDTVQVTVARHVVGEAELPFDNGVVKGAGVYMVAGFLLVE